MAFRAQPRRMPQVLATSEISGEYAELECCLTIGAAFFAIPGPRRTVQS
jgi:hypothetical protein